MQKEVIDKFASSFSDDDPTFSQVIIVKIFSSNVDQAKKQVLRGALLRQIFF